ncbi:uncharacterized protein LOC110186008 [Drosophila serrata]|uniref:uncharacterized protein LOC110186008 n=1 Tax=Drosophila serrata TaxID=7274 RepID=UPI000A1D0411|nr:uncharacterized protein LOC110186008 [Drosophila serrata]
MRCKLICCAFVGLLLLNFSNAIVFKFSNFVCESYNKSWFLFHECRLKAVSREKVVLNMNGTLLHPVYNVLTKGKMFKRESGFKPWLLETKVDACRFMRKNYDPIAKIVYGFFKEFTNINHTCPFVGPQIVKGFYLKPELLALPFPTGEYLLSLRWLFDQKLQFDTNVSFLFVEDIKKA